MSISLIAWVKVEDGKLVTRNFGDELSYHLLKLLADCPVAIRGQPGSEQSTCELLFIGSILHSLTTENCVVWGSGVIAADRRIAVKPRRICAVRGPLSRQKLLDQGIECPEVYGDPALLLPLVYRPTIRRRYKIGIIPHQVETSLPTVLEFHRGNPNVLILKPERYGHWKTFVNKIASCDLILSSSLHGLIVADAYGVPNVWIKLSHDKVIGGEFKFCDYFQGVGRDYVPPVDFSDGIDLDLLKIGQGRRGPLKFDRLAFLKPCPFPLRKGITEAAAVKGQM